MSRDCTENGIIGNLYLEDMASTVAAVDPGDLMAKYNDVVRSMCAVGATEDWIRNFLEAKKQEDPRPNVVQAIDQVLETLSINCKKLAVA